MCKIYQQLSRLLASLLLVSALYVGVLHAHDSHDNERVHSECVLCNVADSHAVVGSCELDVSSDDAKVLITLKSSLFSYTHRSYSQIRAPPARRN